MALNKTFCNFNSLIELHKIRMEDSIVMEKTFSPLQNKVNKQTNSTDLYISTLIKSDLL